MNRNILDYLFGIEWLNETEFIPTNYFSQLLMLMAVNEGNFISEKPFVYKLKK